MATLSTFFDMVYVQVSGSPGTGNATLGSALIGFQTPAVAGITNGTPISYRMTDGTNWETAHGSIDVSGSTYTLVRGVDTIRSSNSNSTVNFTASSGVTVLICPLSQDLNAFFSINKSIYAGLAGSAISCPTASSIYMGGFGSQLSFTPTKHGIVLVGGVCNTVVASANAGDIIRTYLYYGTGSPPAAGAAATGTQEGQFSAFNYSPTIRQYSTPSFLLSLSVGTAYWFDVAAADATSNSASITLFPGPGWFWEF
jgi:hypothetical protein